MRCPYCQTIQQPAAPECPACRLTFQRTRALVGAPPPLAPVVADTTGSLDTAEQARLKLRVARIQRRFPQLVLQVAVCRFPAGHPFSMHAFWLLNAGNFPGDARRGKNNHALLIALDPARGEAAIAPGYGLESFLRSEALDHLLELASPAWENGRWADGLHRVLDELDHLLESIAIPEDPAAQEKGVSPISRRP